MTDPTNKPEDKPEDASTAGAPPPAAETNTESTSESTAESIPPPPGTEPEDAAEREFDAAEIEAGKTFAILSYALSFVGLPFFLVPVIMRENRYSLFHAKQSMMIWLAGIISGAVSAILTVICIGPIIAMVAGIILLVLNIMGLIQSINGQAKPLPLIGPYAVKWFKGLTIVSKS
ncbi:MAG: DUF4870 domain-containing protein [Kiritimatiellae bacterium]|jgi:uncharacterized membrane protein|nr:DUF4870 domain-containing protein [Kiritimatiellia bacterium]